MKPNIKILEVQITPSNDVEVAVNLPPLPPGADPREAVTAFGIVLADVVQFILDGLEEKEVIHSNERKKAEQHLVAVLLKELQIPRRRRSSFQS